MSIRKVCYLLVVWTLLWSLLPRETVAASNVGEVNNVGDTLVATLNVPVVSAPSKILVDNDDTTTLTELARNGATLLVDYGAFSLWRSPASLLNKVYSRPSVSQPTTLDRIELREKFINTTVGPAVVPVSLRQSKSSDYQFWLLQFVGPIKNEWLTKLRKLDITPVIYMPNNAYVVWLNGAGLAQLEALATSDPTIQFVGAYQPAYRLSPRLQGKNTPAATTTNVTVQFYNNPAVSISLAKLRAMGRKILRAPEQVLNFINISLTLPTSELNNIANWNDVFNVEPYTPIKKLDEAQGQILAGNISTVTNTVPSGPGYLSWLASNGFPTDPSQYPIVDVVDDGIDDGSLNPLHPDFHTLGISTTNSSRLVFNNDCTYNNLADSQNGHGNINAGIVAGYNNATGFPYQDANGYRLGLGISPYGRVAGTKIFPNVPKPSDDETNCGGNFAGVVANAYNSGANITSNSWGSDTAGAYNSDDQAYDAFTRDASSSVSGNQPMLHIFAAGNAGSGVSSIGSPGSAKNVIAVGATENVRDNGVTDGCGSANAANADNIANFSARGPTSDNRVKPDIMAPGIHIQGPASQDPAYTAGEVCNRYYPAGQTLYTWSTGTSHSTPAIAGVASLLYNYYTRVLNPGQIASPAMLKALLLNSPRYLNGVGAGGTLPNNNQGWGDANLGMLFDGTPRLLTDQSYVFSNTGQTYNQVASVVSTTRPVRISLVWTDAPGLTTGNAYVNNLDLQVTIGGQIYKGNVFSGPNSVTGGSFDARNNVENVFLPAGISGNLAVKVTAANIAGQADPTLAFNNQDFALVISNAASVNAPVLALSNLTYTDNQPGGNGNGSVEPGETINLQLGWANNGNQSATSVSGTISVTSGNATILTGTAPYPNILVGQTITNSLAYSFRISSANPCGVPINFVQTLTYNNGGVVTTTFSIPTGTPGVGVAKTYSSSDIPKNIPDNNSNGVTSSLSLSAGSTVSKLTVTVDISHTFDSDLVIQLVSPGGITVTLSNRNGDLGQGFVTTTFDDAASTPIANGIPPYNGSFKPDQPLAVLNGQSINGTWKLFVADVALNDTGTLRAWSLSVAPTVYSCNSATIVATGGTPQTAQVNTTFINPLQARVQDYNSNPVAGQVISFAAPTSGPGGTFANNSPIFTGTTDSSGFVTTTAFVANSVAGSYAVTAMLNGAANPAVFTLTNTNAPTNTSLPPTSTSTATPTPPVTATSYTYYLPFLASSYVSPPITSGSFTTFLAFQNAGSGPANVSLSYYDVNGTALTAANVITSLAQYGEALPPNPFGPNTKGAGVIVSNQPLNVVVAEATPYGGSAYVVEAGTANTLVAPIISNGANGGFVTQLTIFNAGTSTTNFGISYYTDDGIFQGGTVTSLEPHTTYTVNQAGNSSFPPGRSGWAEIVANGNLLAAQVLEQNPNNHFVAIANAQPAPAGVNGGNPSTLVPTTLYAPAIFKDAYGGFVTGANIVNPNSLPISVTVSYYTITGTLYSAPPFTLNAFGVQGIFQGGGEGIGLPPGGLPANFTGAAIVAATGGVVMLVNEAGGVTQGGTAKSGTYAAVSSGSNSVGLPVIANNGFGYTTGNTILNTTGTVVTAKIQYYQTDGTSNGPAQTFQIGPYSSQPFFQGDPAIGLSNGFYGTALVTQTGGPVNALIVTTNALSDNFFYTYTEPGQQN